MTSSGSIDPAYEVSGANHLPGAREQTFEVSGLNHDPLTGRHILDVAEGAQREMRTLKQAPPDVLHDPFVVTVECVIQRGGGRIKAHSMAPVPGYGHIHAEGADEQDLQANLKLVWCAMLQQAEACTWQRAVDSAANSTFNLHFIR
jgi:hypothetical protein